MSLVPDQSNARPSKGGEHLLLGGVQQREVPFERDEQIDPPGVRQGVGVE